MDYSDDTTKMAQHGAAGVTSTMSAGSEEQNYISISKLLISGLEASDYGDYKCAVWNELGNHSFSFTIIEQKPDPPRESGNLYPTPPNDYQQSQYVKHVQQTSAETYAAVEKRKSSAESPQKQNNGYGQTKNSLSGQPVSTDTKGACYRSSISSTLSAITAIMLTKLLL